MVSTPSLLKRGRRRGSVMATVALMMVVLLSFAALAVDYGMMLVTRNQLQRACDAAALAGATELPASDTYRTSLASYQAQLTAFRNSVPYAETSISFPASNRIQVRATRVVPTLFARIMGITSNTVSAQALAGRSALKGIPGNVPLAITVEDYNKFKDGTLFSERLVNNNQYDFVPGTMTALDLRLDGSGKSGAVFETDLTNGYAGTTVIGQPVNSALNANLSSENGKLENAFYDRFNRSRNAPWYDMGLVNNYPNYSPTNPRIITLIVADPAPANNNNPTVTIRFFAAVYLERVIESNVTGDTVQMRLLPKRDFGSTDSRVVLADDPNADSAIGVTRLLG